ncbi:MAG: R.Pab1 family restriction endonuclease [Alphaproteobacteria bacterium]|nr:R.Pab1 family restriction endonuclease [Alphaproteobacteria bacterium]
MIEAKVVNTEKDLYVELPMVQPMGKVRVKKRSFFSEYGQPVATRQVEITSDCYVEWQIGYDLLKNEENEQKTSLKDFVFKNYKGENKYLYELCEIVYYSYKKGLLSLAQIKKIYEDVVSLSDNETFEQLDSICISRTDPKETIINGVNFYKMTVSYPLLVHKFGEYEIFAEIVVKEKQRAVGTQAMLYVCLPVNVLKFDVEPMGRTLESKEVARWVIGKSEAELSMEMFRIFGMLSPKHKKDVGAILETMFDL